MKSLKMKFGFLCSSFALQVLLFSFNAVWAAPPDGTGLTEEELTAFEEFGEENPIEAIRDNEIWFMESLERFGDDFDEEMEEDSNDGLEARDVFYWPPENEYCNRRTKALKRGVKEATTLVKQSHEDIDYFLLSDENNAVPEGERTERILVSAAQFFGVNWRKSRKKLYHDGYYTMTVLQGLIYLSFFPSSH